jgi:hypothetical protein
MNTYTLCFPQPLLGVVLKHIEKNNGNALRSNFSHGIQTVEVVISDSSFESFKNGYSAITNKKGSIICVLGKEENKTDIVSQGEVK